MQIIRLAALLACVGTCLWTTASVRAASLQEHYNRYTHLLKQQKYLEAVPEARIVLQTSEKSAGPKALQTGITALNLANLYSALGWYDRAESYLDEAKTAITANTKRTDPSRIALLEHLSSFYLGRGDYDQAAAVLKQWLDIARSTGAPAPTLIAILTRYARAERFSDIDCSVKYLKKALKEAHKVYKKDDPRTGAILLDLAETYLAHKKYDDAKNYYEEVLDHYAGSRHSPTRLNYATWQELAFVYYIKGDQDQMLSTLGKGNIGRFKFEKTAVELAPAYPCPPSASKSTQQDNWAYVGFDVDKNGRAVNARVIVANPPIKHDKAVLHAMHHEQLPPSEMSKFQSGFYGIRAFVRCTPVEALDASKEPPERGPTTFRAHQIKHRLAAITIAPEFATNRSLYEQAAVDANKNVALNKVEDTLSQSIEASEKPGKTVATAWYDYAALLESFHEKQLAEEAAKQSLSIFERISSKKAPDLVPVLTLLGSISSPDEDADYLARALDIAKAHFGDMSLRTADILYFQSMADPNSHKFDESAQKSFEIYRKNPNTDQEIFAAHLFNYAQKQFGYSLHKSERSRDIEILKELLSGPGLMLPATNPYVRAAHYYLAELLAAGDGHDSVAAAKHAAAAGSQTDPIFLKLIGSIPVVKSAPYTYPDAARTLHIQGSASISYQIDPTGKISDPVIVASFPVGVFDTTMINLIRHWKYLPPVTINGSLPLPLEAFRVNFILRQQ